MADLTVTLTESVTLQGESRGSTNTLTIGSVESTLERIVTCPASQTTTVATFNSNVYGAAGAIDIEDTKYIRITNLDSTNAVNLGLAIDATDNGADQNCTILLGAGQTFVMGVAANGIQAHDNEGGAITTGALDNLESIEVNGGSNSVSLEVFVAGSEG